MNDLNKLLCLQINKLTDSIYKKNFNSIELLSKKGLPDLINLNNNDDGKTPLITAVQLGDIEIVKFLLNNGADPNRADFKNRIPLMFACQIADIDLVKILCDFKSNLNHYDIYFKTSLSYCFISSSIRHIECVNLLIKYGADCNLQTNITSPFLDACERSNFIEPICLILISNGNANLNSQNKLNGNKPIHYACLNGSINLCFSLLKNGYDPNDVNYFGQTPSHLAAQEGKLDILRLLWSFGADLNKTDYEINRPIHYLFKKFNQSINKKSILNLIKYLTSRNCKPIEAKSKNILLKEINKNKKFKKYLFKTAWLNYKKYKRVHLIEVDKTFDLKTELINKEYFLYWMMKLNDLFQSVNELLKELFYSIYNDLSKINYDLFKSFFQTYVLNDIPDVILKKFFNLISKNGFVLSRKIFDLRIYTIISSLKFNFDKKIKLKKVKLKKNLKQKLNNKKHSSKIFIPVQNIDLKGPNYQFKYFDCIDSTRSDLERAEFEHVYKNDSKWYINCPSKTKIELANLINSGDIKTIEKILINKKQIFIKKILNLKDKYHKAPLMIAIMKGDENMIDFLLSKNVDLNLSDNFKWTALHHAVNLGSLELVKKLVENGSSLNLKTISGKTPLNLALALNRTEIVIYFKSLKTR